MSEGVDIALDGRQRDLPPVRALDQEVNVVDSLGARDNLLASDEQVVAVGQLGVLWARHGIEGADGQGVLVHDKELSLVLLLD